jgi:transcription initiation factor IIF auxiliary subunit
MALKIAQDYKYLGDDYWHWSVWIEGPARERNQVKSVTYNLHPSFRNPVRRIDSRQDNFRLESAGWGAFTLYATILDKDDSTQRLQHDLVLRYPESMPNCLQFNILRNTPTERPFATKNKARLTQYFHF